MFVIRLVALAALLAIGGSVLAWLLTGNPRYRRMAWNITLGGLVTLLVVLLVFVAERLIVVT
ncbi:MAG: hypothetical protein LPJ87_10715 [Zoogloeaceae bacterium]|nr:hypothetical protein [Zoogloeaceae bacterium]